MGYEFEPEVASALAERGYMVDGRLRRRDIAVSIAEWLEEDGHVAESVERQEEVAATIDEIAIGLLGTTDARMHEIVAGLSGPRGMVQTAGLSDGLVLASVRVTRMVAVDGVPPRERMFSARLLSADPEVLRGTIITQQYDRLANSIAGTGELLEVVGKRVPDLAGERDRVLTAIAEKATQLALPTAE